jgi:hypothetical protein
MRADHDHAGAVLLGDLDEALPGRRGLGARNARVESGLLGKFRAVGRGRFGGLPDGNGVVGVEVLSANWQEADVRRLPDAGDQRLTAGLELLRVPS